MVFQRHGKWRKVLITRNRIAFLAFVAVIIALSYYIYDFSAEGSAYLLGMAAPVLGVALLFAFGAARRKKPMRVDIAFMVAAVFLIWLNRENLFYAYDLRQLQAEARSSSDPSKVLQESTTEFASLMRSMEKLATETQTKVNRVFKSVIAPTSNDIFASKWTNEPADLTARFEAANEMRSNASQILPEIQQILAEETIQATKIVGDFPAEMKRGLLQGLSNKRTAERSIIERKASILERYATALSSMSEYLLARSEVFLVDESGKFIFKNEGDVDEFNRHARNLAELAKEEVALDAEIAEYEKKRRRVGTTSC